MSKLSYLEAFLVEQGLSKSDVCIVGSYAMELAGLRVAGDIDIVLRRAIRAEKGFAFNSATKVNEVVEVVASGWAMPCGMTDDQLIDDVSSTIEVEGFRVASTNLLRKKKELLARPKDLSDLELLSGGCKKSLFKFQVGGLVKAYLRRLRSVLVYPLRRIRSAVRKVRWANACASLVQGRYELAISPENLISAEYIDGEYTRYDTIVRLLAVEGYHTRNQAGFELYNKMQAARGAPEGYEPRFRSLIQSVDEASFDWKSVLDVTAKGYLRDGSHRLALALYHAVPVVTARMVAGQLDGVEYGLEWFKANGFSELELAQMIERKEQLFWDKGLYFSVVLWPPVADYFDEIQAGVGHRVVSVKDYAYSDSEFEEMVRSVYEMDDIAEWKVCKKLSHFSGYTKKVRVLWLEFPNPEYRKKVLNNADISQVGERLKAKIRSKYKGRVSNYTYDIICHTGDNWIHNKKVRKLFGAGSDSCELSRK